MPIDCKIKIKNYKCFGENEQGFDCICPINIIIGRNNSGKSSLIDLIQYVISPHEELFRLGHLGKKPEVFITQPLTEEEVESVFPENNSYDGEISANDLWEFGQKWIGENLTYKLTKDETVREAAREFHSFEKPFPLKRPERFEERLTTKLKNPFERKLFRRISSERDIVREIDRNIPLNHPSILTDALQSNGIGATNLIQNFLNKTIYPRDLVRKKMLAELNTIVKPDLSFTDIIIRQDSENYWEIYLEDDKKGIIALSKMGSGIKTILLVLINLYLIPSLLHEEVNTFYYGFEELENNLHPALQRKLFDYLRVFALKYNTIFFITTHSNVVIDLFQNDSEAQLLHVTHDGVSAKTKPVKNFVDNIGILDDLDIRSSDLLQSNGVIWLEGPSDRIYLKKWIELFSDIELKEGLHYQCVFYGGKLLSHLAIKTETSQDDTGEFIDLLKINTNLIVLIDSDKQKEDDDINDTKKRIIKELSSFDYGMVWVTSGKEIENYLPKQSILKHYSIDGTKITDLGQYENFADYLDKINEGEGKKFSANKVKFASQISNHLEVADLSTRLNLREKMDDVIRKIKMWNKL